MNSHQIFRKIIEQGQSFSSFQKVNSLIPTTQQDIESSVAIIMRVKKTNVFPVKANDHQKILSILSNRLKFMRQAQVLFLQRSNDGKTYSGDICLPGGKVQKYQTPLQAALRQTVEEIGLKLNEDQLLGTLNNKFMANKRGKKRMFTYAFVFLIEQTPELKPCQRQIVDYRWVSLNELMDQSAYQELRINLKDMGNYPYLANKIEHFFSHIKYIQYPSVNIGMKKNLYGLTLYILAFFVSKTIPILQNTISVLNKIETNSIKITNKLEQKIVTLKRQLERFVYFSNKFKNQYEQPVRIEFESQNIQQKKKHEVQDKFFKLLELGFPRRPKL